MIKKRNCRKYGSAVLRQSHDLLKLGHLYFHPGYRDGSSDPALRPGHADTQTNRDCSTTTLATCEAPLRSAPRASVRVSYPEISFNSSGETVRHSGEDSSEPDVMVRVTLLKL
jgi:hypothetical protein